MTGATTSATDFILEIRNVSKRFGALLANDDISLTLRHGEVLALLGENCVAPMATTFPTHRGPPCMLEAPTPLSPRRVSQA